ncbi:MAG TPA: biotin/lipoyl-binding protein, partial [Candidatus Polarisedimenticolia bacterium]|nr:biotin/lipoyl-binding protein [Candidatus Polarisedimenticolia bacterium]
MSGTGEQALLIEESLPALRKDLEFVGRQPRGKPLRYWLSDRRVGKVFDLGPEENFICRQLDGRNTAGEVLAMYEAEFGRPLERAGLDALVDQLRGEGFLEGQPARKRTLPEIFDPEEFLPFGRLALLRGDGVMDWMTQRLGWIFSKPVKFIAAGLILLGLNVLVREWPSLFDAVWYHWGPFFLLSIIMLSSVLVHAPRAMIQGVACKRSGGYVSEIGLVFFYYLIPEPYCKYTDLGWIREKSKLLWTLISGLYYQALVWAVATIGWFVTTQGTVINSLWLALAVGSGGGLLLLVGNPLVKMDGYHILATWSEFPRLRERSLAAFGSWISGRPMPEPLPPTQRRWVLFFGFLISLFAVAHLVILVALAGLSLTELYEGAGFVATVAFAAFLVHRPLGKYLSGLKPVQWAKQGWSRLTGWGWKGVILLVVVIILLLPYPYETGGPFTVFPSQKADIYCEIEGGRIEKVLVKEGEFVTKGQALGQIDRREYEKNFLVTQASLEDTEAKLNLLRKELAMLDNPPDIETIHAFEAEARRLKALATDYQTELALTTLLSPIDGRVTTPMIDQ